MSRRSELKQFFLGAAPAVASTSDDASPPQTTSPTQGAEVAGVAGAMRKSISQFTRHAADLERRLVNADAVVDLDVDLIDPSFAVDRMAADDGAALESLIASIRDHGQRSPILVRPHPTHDGRYQIAFGHRRLAAAKALGLPVKAVVRSLDDAELVVAQGQENAERQDLSYIERALFMKALSDRGFSREVQMAALGAATAEISRFIAVLRDVPEDVIRAIGPAPGQGRRRWLALGAAIAANPKGATGLVRHVEGKTSDDRFASALSALSKRPTVAKPAVQELTNADGQVVMIARRTRNGLAIEWSGRDARDSLAEAAIERLAALAKEVPRRAV